MPGRRQQTGFSVVCKKRPDLILPLGPEHRAGAVHQSSARLEQRPERPQQARLLRRELGHIAFTAQPAHVGVAAHDARGGAGRVEQDGIKSLPVPPALGRARISRQDLGLQAQAPQGVRYAVLIASSLAESKP